MLTMALAILACNPEKDNPIEEPEDMQYLVNEISTSPEAGAVSFAPTVSGAAPYTFSIANIHNGNLSIDPDAISINPTSGIINLAEGNLLPSGIYSIDVAVTNFGGETVFTNAFTFNILEVPTELAYVINEIEITPGTDTISNPPSIVNGENVKFQIVNAPEDASFISINEYTGEIMVDGQFAMIGEYSIDVLVITELGYKISFPEAYSISVVSPEPVKVKKITNLFQSGAEFYHVPLSISFKYDENELLEAVEIQKKSSSEKLEFNYTSGLITSMLRTEKDVYGTDETTFTYSYNGQGQLTRINEGGMYIRDYTYAGNTVNVVWQDVRHPYKRTNVYELEEGNIKFASTPEFTASKDYDDHANFLSATGLSMNGRGQIQYNGLSSKNNMVSVSGNLNIPSGSSMHMEYYQNGYPKRIQLDASNDYHSYDYLIEYK